MKNLKLINQLIVFIVITITMNIYIPCVYAEELPKQKGKIPKTTKPAETIDESSNNKNREINNADYEIAISSVPINERYAAIARINNQFLLACIVKDKVDPRIAHAALGRITLPSCLKDIAGSAAYASVRKVAEARRLQQWRKDLEVIGSGHCNNSCFGSICSNYCTVSIQNKNPELAYTNIKYQPLNSTFSFISGNFCLDLDGTAKPASSGALTVSSANVYNMGAERVIGVIILLQADPVLLTLDEHEPVISGWKFRRPTHQQLTSLSPEIAEDAVIGSTVQSNVLGKIVGVTTNIIITASDPNFDELTYIWTASNGTILKYGSENSVYWDRPVDSDRRGVQPGSITVVVSNSRGEKAEKTFRLDYPSK